MFHRLFSRTNARGRVARASGQAASALVALGLAVPWVAVGCSQGASDERSHSEGWLEPAPKETKRVKSLQELLDSSRTILLGREMYVVETDMAFDRAGIERYYEETYVHPVKKSIVNLVSGVRDTRSIPTAIKYCFAAGWGQPQVGYTAPPLEPTRTNLASGMRSWEAVANVRFVYMSNLDGAGCTNSGPNPGVSFVIQHYNNSSTAIGPFPSLPWSQQALLVPTVGLPRTLAIHEVGHSLGLRHEHINPSATPSCFEDNSFQLLTGFDTLSAMKYANCTVSNTIAGNEVSQLDGVGLRILYGIPASWADLVLL